MWWAGVLLSTCFFAGFSTCFTAAAGFAAGAVLVVAGFAVAGAVMVGLAVVAGLVATGEAAAESVFTVFFSTLAGFSALTGAGVVHQKALNVVS